MANIKKCKEEKLQIIDRPLHFVLGRVGSFNLHVHFSFVRNTSFLFYNKNIHFKLYYILLCGNI